MRFSFVLFVLVLASAVKADDGFPFVIRSDQSRGGVTDFSYLNARAAGADGFVRRDGARFATDAGPVRFWGVNLCFGGNFLEPEDAEKLAKHLASMAVNCVRIHHQETQYAPVGLYAKGGEHPDPGQVEKLDYLLAKLHEQGIYANLNLHVGRNVAREMGLPPLGAGHSSTGDKHLLHFFPPVQEAFWQYCRDYLGHTNPHRKLRRADDPGIAMIEILNENRFHKDGSKHLLNAPEPYRAEILKQWNGWLKKTYGDDAAMRAAWGKKAGERAVETLVAGSWKKAEGGVSFGDGWAFNDNGGKPAVALTLPEDGVLRIAPQGKAESAWHSQLFRGGLSMEMGEQLTFSFEARAEGARKMQYSLASLEGGWKSLGASDSVLLAEEWKTFVVRFKAAETSGVGKIGFDLGDSEIAVELRNVELMRGGRWKQVPQGQSIAQGSVEIPAPDWEPAAQKAFVEFMADTERAFYRKTRALLKELGVRVPVTTTQVNYQGAAMAAELGDYTDIHSYWHHPLFPGREWDGDNWTIGHDPLESRPYSNQWPRNNPLIRASWRVHGMPFTYSEWNVGEPSFPAAGAVPIMALLGCLQDWGGVFFFDYASSNKDFHRDMVTTYFSFNAQPAKLALLGPFGEMYRSGALESLKEVHSAPGDAHRGSGVHAFRKLVGIDPELVSPEDFSQPEEADLLKSHPPLLVTPDGAARWDARDPEKATITVTTPTSRAIWGKIGGAQVDLGGWKFSVGEPQRGYGVIIANSRDGKPLGDSKRVLITAVNHAANVDFPWKDEAQTAGGWRWGKGSTQVWNVPCKVTVPGGGKVFAVGADGARAAEIAVAGDGSFLIGQSAGTVWFELVR